MSVFSLRERCGWLGRGVHKGHRRGHAVQVPYLLHEIEGGASCELPRCLPPSYCIADIFHVVQGPDIWAKVHLREGLEAHRACGSHTRPQPSRGYFMGDDEDADTGGVSLGGKCGM